MPRLSVLCWNMAYGSTSRFRSRHADAWAYVREQGIDLALLQETTRPTDVDDDHIAFEAKYDGEGWGTAVYAPRLKLEALPVDGTRWLRQLPGLAVPARTRLPDGSHLSIASMHPKAEHTGSRFADEDLSGIKPAYQENVFPVNLMHDDLQRLLGQNFIIGGDLNSALRFDLIHGRNPDFFGNADLFQKFRDSGWRDCHLKFHAGEERTFFRNDDPGDQEQLYMLDHMYASKGWYDCLKSCDVVPHTDVRGLSDHAPLLATFEWATP